MRSSSHPETPAQRVRSGVSALIASQGGIFARGIGILCQIVGFHEREKLIKAMTVECPVQQKGPAPDEGQSMNG
jgi:hypothetical protein